ncbi:MAG: hypothetical protein IT425_07240 [Pirellulales bacterium]|nr:hypothetical protein [Pirellulales bacterium]
MNCTPLALREEHHLAERDVYIPTAQLLWAKHTSPELTAAWYDGSSLLGDYGTARRRPALASAD